MNSLGFIFKVKSSLRVFLTSPQVSIVLHEHFIIFFLINHQFKFIQLQTQYYLNQNFSSIKFQSYFLTSIQLSIFQSIRQMLRQKYSIKVTILMVKIRGFITQAQLELQQFVHQYKDNDNLIPLFNLQKMVQLVSHEQNFWQIKDIYEEFGQKITINKFIQVYKQVLENIPQSMPIYKKQKETNQMYDKPKEIKPKVNTATQTQATKKFAKLGLSKLNNYIKENDANDLFNECDEDKNGSIDKNQFSKFLAGSGIVQFNDKKVRSIVVRHMFKHFPNGVVLKKQFFNFFKINQSPKKPSSSQKNRIIKPQVPKKQSVPQKKPQVPKKQFVPQKKPQIIKKESFPQKIKEPSLKKQQSFEKPQIVIKGVQKKEIPQNNPMKKKQNFLDINNYPAHQPQFINNICDQASVLFPQAYRLYRNGIPSEDELGILEELQGYLQSNKKFIDHQNPKTHMGTYLNASQIFQKKKYRLFMMAQSVINRQKSRIGIARQIEPKDIIQGSIGNCYFLSSIASLVSKYAELISQRFLFQANQSNMFAVKLFIDGEWIIFKTDDRFPCQYNRPVFAKPHNEEVWVMLLEKCWAKNFLSYAKIQSGTPSQGFIALTGAPCQYICPQENDKQKIKRVLQEAYNRKYVATASGTDFLNKLSPSQRQKIGLVANHAYSFLKFLTINGQSVIKMRNPWGSTVWKGRWSFQSKDWTKNLRDQYNYNFSPDDGSFYISWNDFIKYFGNIQICKVNSTYLHTSIRLTSKRNKSTYVGFTVKEEGNYYISVYQSSKRKNEIKYQNYDYSDVRMILVRKEENKMEYICSKNKISSYATTIQTELKPGYYIISTKVFWKFKEQSSSVLTFYGPEKVNLSIIDRKIAPQFKSQLIHSYSRKIQGKKSNYSDIHIPQAFNQYKFDLDDGIGYYRLKNPTKKWFSVTVSMKKMQGIKIIKPNKLPYQFDMQEGVDKVIGFFISARGFNYQISQSMKYNN